MPRESRSDRIKSWLDRLNRFSQLDQTVADFCTSESVSVPSFYQWKHRLSPLVVEPKLPRKRKASKGKASKPGKRHVKKPRTAFTPLAVVDRQATTASISLPGGITIELGTQQDTIATIVERVLRHSSQKQISDAKAVSC